MSEHDNGATGGEQQQQKQQTDERMSMDATDIDDAIDQEQDQKFGAEAESRYEGGVDEALADDDR